MTHSDFAWLKLEGNKDKSEIYTKAYRSELNIAIKIEFLRETFQFQEMKVLLLLHKSMNFYID